MTSFMTRGAYGATLRSKGFIFEKTQKGFPSRGDEDVYSHPGFRYKFYVTRTSRGNETSYGLYTGSKNGEALDSIQERNESDNFRKDAPLRMWTNEAFESLMEGFRT